MSEAVCSGYCLFTQHNLCNSLFRRRLLLESFFPSEYSYVGEEVIHFQQPAFSLPYPMWDWIFLCFFLCVWGGWRFGLFVCFAKYVDQRTVRKGVLMSETGFSLQPSSSAKEAFSNTAQVNSSVIIMLQNLNYFLSLKLVQLMCADFSILQGMHPIVVYIYIFFCQCLSAKIKFQNIVQENVAIT